MLQIYFSYTRKVAEKILSGKYIFLKSNEEQSLKANSIFKINCIFCKFYFLNIINRKYMNGLKLYLSCLFYF